MTYEYNGTVVETDEEGYITDISLWTRELAEFIAKDENINMSDDHWEVVNFLHFLRNITVGIITGTNSRCKYGT